MELILAVDRLARPGGPQTYTLIVGEHLARLGHSVTLYARELGATADLARERGLSVTSRVDDLPRAADGVITSVDRAMAVELAQRHPDAARVFVVHSIDDVHLPPPVDGVVAATVALNDRFAERAAACVGAGEVVRLRQPVDLRFTGMGRRQPPEPRHVLLLGNYHGDHNSRAGLLKQAWSAGELHWEQVGYPDPVLDITPAIARADVVVGYGRSIVEAMAAGRAAYVFDHAGSDGWVTPESYERIEAAGFSGLAGAPPPDAGRLRADLLAYRPELGRLGHDIARAHHDVRHHASALVAILERIVPKPATTEPSALRALTVLSEAQLRAEVARDNNRAEARQWFNRAQQLNEELAAARADLADARPWRDRALELEERLAVQDAEAAAANAWLDAFRSTRRYRFAQALGRMAERARRVRRRG